MKITNLKRYENSFLIFTSLLIALINTLPYLSSVFYADPDSEKVFLRPDFILTRSAWYFIHAFVSILIFAYFNFSWKDYLFSTNTRKWVRKLLIFIYNVLLVALLIAISIGIAEISVGNPFGIKGALFFYFWKYVFLFPFAVLIAHILHLMTKARIIELENSQLKQENLSSQLKSLQDQINPHFLFNSLNTLSSVIRLEKSNAALQFVDDLSNVYRYVLERYEESIVVLEDELTVLQSYINMQKKRFEDKLNIEMDVPRKFLSGFVPPMALHVLVENAIKHNEISAASPLNIKIEMQDNAIVVSNNLQLKSMEQDKLRLGLSNLSKRYNLLTGKDILIRETEDCFIVKIPVIWK